MNGEFHGEGAYFYSNGDVYEGGFVNGVKQGQGKFTYCDGDMHEGQYVADQKHGVGCFKYSDGDEYNGDFFTGRWAVLYCTVLYGAGVGWGCVYLRCVDMYYACTCAYCWVCTGINICVSSHREDAWFRHIQEH